MRHWSYWKYSSLRIVFRNFIIGFKKKIYYTVKHCVYLTAICNLWYCKRNLNNKTYCSYEDKTFLRSKTLILFVHSYAYTCLSNIPRSEHFVDTSKYDYVVLEIRKSSSDSSLLIKKFKIMQMEMYYYFWATNGLCASFVVFFL